MPHLSGSPSNSKSTGRICARWRIGCSGRRAKPRMRSRKAGFDSAGPMSATSRTCAPGSRPSSRVCAWTCCGRGHRAGRIPLDTHVPDPVITRADGDPESDAMLADSVGLALLVVLETLEPAERLAFVLHDVFGMTFDEIAPIVDRSAVAARQLASRARRRVQGRAPNADRDLRQQRRVVDAFLAAAQDGDFERLVAVLDPDIVLRADGGALAGLSRVVRGAQAVAAQAATFSRSGLSNQVVLVNGNIGFVSRRPDGRLFSVIGFTIAGGKIVEMDILADPERLFHPFSSVDEMNRPPLPSTSF